MGLWERYIVPPLIGCACSSKPIMKQRSKVVPMASGEVMELGCGSGTNFGMYDLSQVSHIHAVEPAPGMVKRAVKAAEKLGIEDKITITETGAEAMPVADNSIDTAVITFVLCTIPDWRAALDETRRVLKPGGKVVFTEHGLSPDAGVSKWQRRIEPMWKRLAGGCHLTRDIPALLEEGGFTLDGVETMYLPNSPKFASFVSWGSAHAA